MFGAKLLYLVQAIALLSMSVEASNRPTKVNSKSLSRRNVYHQTSREIIVARGRDKKALKAVQEHARQQRHGDLAPRQAQASCQPAPTCGIDYQPTINSYALFQNWDLYGNDVKNSGGSISGKAKDVLACVQQAQSIGSQAGGMYYVNYGLNNTQTSVSGQCSYKGTSIAGANWISQYNGPPSSTVLFGSCCDYKGIVPSNVYSSCCQTRTCNPVKYPTCNSTAAVGSGYAVAPNWDPYYNDVGTKTTEASQSACEQRCASTIACLGYYYISQGAGGQGNCFLKGRDQSKQTWYKYQNTQAKSAFRGTCCDYEGVWPTNVLSDCCNSN